MPTGPLGSGPLAANARMYAATPDAAAAWAALFARVAARSGVALDLLAHPPPAPMAALWARPDLGAAFMCGRPWTRAEPRPIALVAPVPSPARYGGLPRYCTDIAVRADGPFRTLADTFGGRIGYAIEESHSGYNALRHHLLPHRTALRPRLYAGSVGPLLTPRGVVEALLDGRIDAGPIDGYSLDLMRRDPADPSHRLRVVASTDFAPIPMLVASPGVPAAAVARLREAFLAVATDTEAAGLRERLLLSGFAPVDPAAYDVLTAWDRDAVAAGYSEPG
ncbi:phosphate/phosphite/phosphonate ABC transporter substrate-binding protein [Lichenibacterium dinghuense]|uniref:phosphate/phosphite/phosphonate ABC transporter substrate-binding protein n=1 Tax=Lichenibacterium dinghuense TaxID=2895977 RepID=UPI001F41E788|nr:PhnD/SsuA/transferrin family substrate-binding protein [Lichenibacterium sp. 6Y81]